MSPRTFNTITTAVGYVLMVSAVLASLTSAVVLVVYLIWLAS